MSSERTCINDADAAAAKTQQLYILANDDDLNDDDDVSIVVLIRVSPFFRSSSRPRNRAAVVARSTLTTRTMAAMALRYSYALHDSRIKKRQRRRRQL